MIGTADTPVAAETGRGTGVQRALWGLLVVGSLGVALSGLWDNVYFEPTHEALRTARLGRLHLVESGVGLLAASAWTAWLSRRAWVAVLIAVAGLCCGGVGAGLPWPLVLLALPVAAGGLIGGLLPRARRRGSSSDRWMPVAVSAAAALVVACLVGYALLSLRSILAS